MKYQIAENYGTYSVPDYLIDEYLTSDVSAADLKVFLCLCKIEDDITVEKIAELTELTPGEVRVSLNFWEDEDCICPKKSEGNGVIPLVGKNFRDYDSKEYAKIVSVLPRYKGMDVIGLMEMIRDPKVDKEANLNPLTEDSYGDEGVLEAVKYLEDLDSLYENLRKIIMPSRCWTKKQQNYIGKWAEKNFSFKKLSNAYKKAKESGGNLFDEMDKILMKPKNT